MYLLLILMLTVPMSFGEKTAGSEEAPPAVVSYGEKEYTEYFDCWTKTFGWPRVTSMVEPNRRVLTNAPDSSGYVYLKKNGFFIFKSSFESPSDPGIRVVSAQEIQNYMRMVKQKIEDRYKNYSSIVKGHMAGVPLIQPRRDLLSVDDFRQMKEAICSCERGGFSHEILENALQGLEKDKIRVQFSDGARPFKKGI